jgi:hypothetical protein
MNTAVTAQPKGPRRIQAAGAGMFSNACGGSTIVDARIATELLSYLLRDWPTTKRVIDQEIEKNKELTTYIKGTVERRYKKSA